jgi:hypothetical protein
MLIFGSLDAYRYCRSKVIIDTLINFNTMLEQVPQLMYLNPYRSNQYYGNTNCYEFDMWYVNYLASTPEAFREFINLMREVYNGKNVWVLVDFQTETASNVVETLIKYIMETYGYISNVAHTPDDTENFIEGSFSTTGIQMFDAHMENYLQYFGARGLESDKE